jgi:hypothetical protein
MVSDIRTRGGNNTNSKDSSSKNPSSKPTSTTNSMPSAAGAAAAAGGADGDEKAVEVPEVLGVQLSDGWYYVNTLIDAPTAKLITSGKLTVRVDLGHGCGRGGRGGQAASMVPTVTNNARLVNGHDGYWSTASNFCQLCWPLHAVYMFASLYAVLLRCAATTISALLSFTMTPFVWCLGSRTSLPPPLPLPPPPCRLAARCVW